MKKMLLIYTAVLFSASSKAQLSNGLVAWFRFNGNLNDQSVNANPGTGFGGISYSAGVDGSPNGAVVLDGIDDYVNIENIGPYNLGTGNFTLSYWFNTISSVGSQIISMAPSGSGQFPYYGIASYSGSGNISARTQFNASIEALSTGLNNSQWHHVVFTRFGNLLSIYIDGILKNSAAFTQDNITNFYKLVLGRNQDLFQYMYNGKLDNLRLYNRSITVVEITTLYTSELTGIPLPVLLIGFSGKKQNQEVRLQWQTENEMNLSHFKIERSADGRTFETINIVVAVNTTGRNDYSFRDNSPWISDTRFYRLKIVDADGSYKYSPVIKLTAEEGKTLTIFPNPAHGVITISGLDGKGEITITGINGRELLRQYNSGQSLILDISRLPDGIYIFQYSDSQKIKAQKLIIHH
jgi:hypothetical protein